MKDLYPCVTFIVFASLSVGCGTQVREAGGRGDRHTSHFVITEITFRDHKQLEMHIIKPTTFSLTIKSQLTVLDLQSIESTCMCVSLDIYLNSPIHIHINLKDIHQKNLLLFMCPQFLVSLKDSQHMQLNPDIT